MRINTSTSYRAQVSTLVVSSSVSAVCQVNQTHIGDHITLLKHVVWHVIYEIDGNDLLYKIVSIVSSLSPPLLNNNYHSHIGNQNTSTYQYRYEYNTPNNSSTSLGLSAVRVFAV